jgi:DNA anti-recombination protein RmuC
MKVIELLDEILEICENSSGVFSKKLINAQEIEQIIAEIRDALPEEIEQARFIKAERQRILEEAKNEYELLIKDAEHQAEILVSTSEITKRANQKANEMVSTASAKVKDLKMKTYDYIDSIIYDFQEQMDILNHQHLAKTFETINITFEEVSQKLSENREDIKQLAYKTQVEGDLS